MMPIFYMLRQQHLQGKKVPGSTMKFTFPGRNFNRKKKVIYLLITHLGTCFCTQAYTLNLLSFKSTAYIFHAYSKYGLRAEFSEKSSHLSISFNYFYVRKSLLSYFKGRNFLELENATLFKLIFANWPN